MVIAGLPAPNAVDKESDTCTFVSGTRPRFVTAMVYGISKLAGPTTVGAPAALVTPTICGATVSLSAALLFSLTGSGTLPGGVIVARLVIVPVAVRATAAFTRKVALPSFSRDTGVERLPLPDA